MLLAFLKADLVERFGWLTQAQLLDAVAVGQVAPGPVLTTATFIGASRSLLAVAPGVGDSASPMWYALLRRRHCMRSVMSARIVFQGLLLIAIAPSLAPEAVQARADALPASKPYLQGGQVGRVTLVWRTETPEPARLRIWDDREHLVRDNWLPASVQHEVIVSGLSPGLRYRYQVDANGHALGEGRFIANRGPHSDHLRFAAIGDMGSGAPVQFQIARRMLAYDPEFVISVGDIVYPGGAAADYGPKFFMPYGDLLARTVLYPTLGNHDVRTDNGEPYLRAFSLPQTPGQERYYTFDAGPARFWALDSTQSLSPGSLQYRWLEEDAMRSRAKWKIAFFHHPPFSSGVHSSSPKTQALVQLFSRLGFSAIFTGHDHNYERTLPQGGVTYIVTGGGGAMLYGVAPKPFSAYARSTHHYVEVAISGNTMAAKAIAADGSVLDAWSIRRP